MAKTDDGSDRVFIADLDSETDTPCDGLTVSYDYRYDTALDVACKHLQDADVHIAGVTVKHDHYIIHITDFSFNLTLKILNTLQNG